MKNIKGVSLIRLVAFFVIATILTCTAVFATGGWQSFIQNEPDSDDTADTLLSSGDVDENTDGSNKTEDIIVPIPETKHYLTGLTIPNSEKKLSPISFIYSSNTPLYGISNAFLTIEMPTENGATRYVSLFSQSTYLGKIGSVSPTRNYIDRIANALGTTLIHRGNDDSFIYSDESSRGIDLLTNVGYSYTEYTEFHYTNSDLVTALIKNSGSGQIIKDTATAPFIHSESEIIFPDSALSVVIPYAENNTTQLIYNTTDNAYTLYKGTSAVKDLLNDKSCVYNNVFVLFANATTYENADTTETILDTRGGGEGYYFTRGTATRIIWSTDRDGNLVFTNENGTILSVNVGSSYIAFEKASRKNFITYN